MSRARLLVGGAIVLIAAASIAALIAWSRGDDAVGPEGAPSAAGSAAGADSADKGRESSGTGGEIADALEDLSEVEVERVGLPPSSGDGDDGVESLGREARGRQADAITTSLVAYLTARAESEWQLACELLSSRVDRMLTRLKELTRGESDAPADCPSFMEATGGGAPTGEWQRPTRIGLASVRVKAKRAHAIYEGPEGWMVMPMRREQGRWKVDGIDAMRLR